MNRKRLPRHIGRRLIDRLADRALRSLPHPAAERKLRDRSAWTRCITMMIAPSFWLFRYKSSTRRQTCSAAGAELETVEAIT
jgi:hypothetical protein